MTMTKAWTSLALVPLVLGYAASSGAETARPARSTLCEIRATPVAGGLRLEGVVRGAPDQMGSYRFTLEKSGTDGSSKVGQGGDFTVAASGESAVALTEFSLGSSDTYRANMIVMGPTGEVKCALPLAAN